MGRNEILVPGMSKLHHIRTSKKPQGPKKSKLHAHKCLSATMTSV